MRACMRALACITTLILVAATSGCDSCRRGGGSGNGDPVDPTNPCESCLPIADKNLAPLAPVGLSWEWPRSCDPAAGDPAAGDPNAPADPAKSLDERTAATRAELEAAADSPEGGEGGEPADAGVGDAGGDFHIDIISYNGFDFRCLDIAGNSWHDKWVNLAQTSLDNLRDRPLDGGDGTFPAICTDSSAQHLMRYLVKCALPQGETLELFCGGDRVELDGELGMAPDWRNQVLDHGVDGRDPMAVSACIMAHANPGGYTVPLRLESSEIRTNPSANSSVGALFSLAEGRFAGNLFPTADEPLALYACRDPGYPQTQPPVTAPGRACTIDPDTCGFALTTCDALACQGESCDFGVQPQGAAPGTSKRAPLVDTFVLPPTLP